jgi:chemotaxis protein methyltransferase CheR
MIAADFNYIAMLLKERSGLIVTPDKSYLFETRLGPVARRYNLKSIDHLIASMRATRSEALTGEVVDAMTTNETSFFRDRHPFDALRHTILPALINRRARQRHLRIWSAACSTGQEAYSLSMMLRDEFPLLGGWNIEIIGTDISPSVVARAKDGTYSTFEVQRGLPVKLLIAHFEQDGDQWRIKSDLRRMVEFRLFNLLGSLAPLGHFDVVMCRNVLIYFDLPTKTRVLESMHRQLSPDGALILGGAESVFGICSKFTDIAGVRGVYRPISAQRRTAADARDGTLNDAAAGEVYAALPSARNAL